MIRDQLILDVSDEIIVDLFAGGGGMSLGIEQALGRHVDIAINHNADALSLHEANHPQTKHYVADVFEVDPRVATQGRKVGLLHLSPDCTHFSQASSGQPRSRKIRGLAWVGYRWMRQVSPRVITLENVRQMKKWGPLIAKRDKETGRVVKIDGSIAAPGERVPIKEQFLVPNPKREGETWEKYKALFRRENYSFDDEILCAADHGAPTSRERLVAVARRDGMPAIFPAPKYFHTPKRGQKRWPAAALCIDFSIPCPSIFTRPRPLAEKTMRRIAKGVVLEVLQNAKPFIVPITHNGSDRVNSITEPLRTITTAHRGEFALIAPTMVKFRGDSHGGSVADPMPTITSGGGAKRPAGCPHALGVATAFLAQMNGGNNQTAAHDLRLPVSTISAKGSQQQVITAHLAQFRQNCWARDARDPLPTITANGLHHGLVQCTLSPDDESGALRVAAFLMRYYSQGGQWGSLLDPMPTVTTADRLALVTVMIEGWPWCIVDIGLRMLCPRELYLAQGFPRKYIIDRGHDGRKFSKSAQVRMVGNSVPPPLGAAVIAANVPELALWSKKELHTKKRFVA